MDFHPVRYTKDHPVGVAFCILLGMGAAHFGFGFSALPFRFHAGVRVAQNNNGDGS